MWPFIFGLLVGLAVAVDVYFHQRSKAKRTAQVLNDELMVMQTAVVAYQSARNFATSKFNSWAHQLHLLKTDLADFKIVPRINTNVLDYPIWRMADIIKDMSEAQQDLYPDVMEVKDDK